MNMTFKGIEKKTLQTSIQQIGENYNINIDSSSKEWKTEFFPEIDLQRRIAFWHPGDWQHLKELYSSYIQEIHYWMPSNRG